MQIKDDLFVETGVPYYSNRYYHCANSDTYIMAGSLPVVRFGKRRAILGSFRFFDEHGRPLDEEPDVAFYFTAGECRWETKHAVIWVSAPEDRHAMVLRVDCDEPVTVRYGGVHYAGDGGWNVCPDFEGNYRTVAFDEAQLGESYLPEENGFTVCRPEVEEYLERHTGKRQILHLRCTLPMGIERGMAVTHCKKSACFTLELCPENTEPLTFREASDSAAARSERLTSALKAETPDPVLNAACAYAANYMDGIWYPPLHVHAEMTWSIPFLGWTNRYGADVLGWHDQMLRELQYYEPYQIKEDVYTDSPLGDRDRYCTLPPMNSRFYGKGRITQDQGMYCMQSFFFDQAIHSWRMSGDPEMLKTLRPMLELHCEYLDDCFDPEGRGIYESVIDSWPTDSVWCDGGGAPEATCFAYRAHLAAYDMARIEKDVAAERRHGGILERIRKGFRELLWSDRLGVAGKCREQGENGRLMENPWSYSVFMPIDMELLDPVQAAQALYYSEWAYQSEATPNGRLVYHSNWVPMVWSVRPKGGLEQYMLAHAFFKAGFPEDGLALINGMLDQGSKLHSDGSHIAQSGGLQSEGSRAVLEGLFGYRPDYPNGRVTLAPSLPFDWRDASVSTTEMSFNYKRTQNEIRVRFTLPKTARVTLSFFLYSDKLLGIEGENVSLDSLQPSFGRTRVVLDCGECRENEIVLSIQGEREPLKPDELRAEPNGELILTCAGSPKALLDPQGIADSYELKENGIRIKTADISGHHWLCTLLNGDMPRYQVYHIDLAPTARERFITKNLRPDLTSMKEFRSVDISRFLNCDVQAIYQQEYLSPRPLTASARIGINGYSPWTFSYWKNEVPQIVLSRRGTVRTQDGVPLTVSEGGDNIAFVSRWDNFPDSITVPVNARAKAAALLLCGTTNPMQCGAENVRLIFEYANGEKDEVPISNPTEFWSLCPLNAMPNSDDQVLTTSSDYDYALSAFCLPKTPPETIQLGENCRAVVIRWKTRENETLKSVTLRAVAKEIVIGLMSLTLID